MKQSAISHKVQGGGCPLPSPSSPILCFFADARAFGAPCALRARARGRTQATYLGDARDAAASTSLCGQGSRLQLLGTHGRVLAQLEVDVTALCIVERRVPWVVRGHG